MLDSLNPAVIGYTLNIVGLFFLASAITFKKPRREIEEILQVERPRSLSTVRDHLVNRVQVTLGFVLIVAGHVLLMSQAVSSQDSSPEATSPVFIFLVLAGATLVTGLVLKLVELLFTRRKFRRLLAEVVRDADYSLERNQNIAVQIGECLQIPQTRDESVPEYIEKVQRELGLITHTRPPGPKDRKTPRPPAETPRT